MLTSASDRRFQAKAPLLAFAVLVAVGGASASVAAAGQANAVAADHDQLIEAARRGDIAPALDRLAALHRAEPTNSRVAHDYVVVLTWAGRDAEAAQVFAGLDAPAPVFVLEAVAKSYRNLRRYADAVALYRAAQAPDSSRTAPIAGEIMSAADAGDLDAAVARGTAATAARPNAIELRLAYAYALIAAERLVDALAQCDAALAREPEHREARRERIRIIERMGAARLALDMARQAPDLFGADEMRRLEASAAAMMVRFGRLPTARESERFRATDLAIAELDALIARASAMGARRDALRARFDRLLALRDRSRMDEVVAEYEDLVRDGVDVPDYVLPAVAGAYLHLRRPEAARALYQRALSRDPKNLEAGVGLFYALVEVEDLAAAIRQIDSLNAGQASWIWLPGLKEPVANRARVGTEMAAANARLYADDLAEAQRRFEDMAALAPHNATLREGLAGVYAARGWPRRAATEIEIARAVDPRDSAIEIAEARNALTLREYRRVAPQDLIERYPESLAAQRVARLWEVHHRPQLQVTAARSFRSETNVAGGDGLVLDTRLLSPPLADNYRLTAGYALASERFTEGSLHGQRAAAGLEYRGRDLLASVEATGNFYEESRAGGSAAAAWTLDDHWEIGVGAEIVSRETPLRALKNRITANSASLAAIYREDESRRYRLSASVLDFSDGNLRAALGGQATQRVVNQPHLKAEASLGLAASRNSETDGPYYSPRRDLLGSVTFDIGHVLYRRYELSYEHRLALTPGYYWQDGFGGDFAGSVRYEHRLRANDVLDLTLGASVARQSFDGTPENSAAILFSLDWRF